MSRLSGVLFAVAAAIVLPAGAAFASSLDTFLADPKNKADFEQFPKDVQQSLIETSESENRLLDERRRRMPQGTTECFDHYRPESVDLQFDSTVLTGVAGRPVQFVGTLRNNNPYPVVEGSVYVKIFRYKGKNVVSSELDGFPLVDQFVGKEGISLPANGEREIQLQWMIPAGAGEGQYFAALYFVTANRYSVTGLTFTDDVTGNHIYFEVESDELQDSPAYFEKESVTLNGRDYHFAQPPLVFGPEEKVTVEAKIVNPSEKQVVIPLKWSLYPWDGLRPDRMISSESAVIQLEPGESRVISHVVSPHKNTVSYLVAETTDHGVQSILDIRFVRRGVEETRLEFPTLLKYPVVAGEENSLFVCAHSTFIGEVGGNDIKLILKDESGSVIASKSYSGILPTTMTGVRGDFTPTSTSPVVFLTARLERNGELVEESTQKYDCSAIDPALCPGPPAADTNRESRPPSRLPELAIIILGVVSLVVLALVIYKKHKNAARMASVVALGFTVSLFGSSVEAKTSLNPLSWTATEVWDHCGDLTYNSVDVSGAITYSADLKDITSNVAVVDGSSVQVGHTVRVERSDINEWTYQQLYHKTTGGCNGSPYGAWTADAVNPTASFGNQNFAVNPPSVSVSNTGTASVSCSGTDCLINGPGSVTITADYGVTYAKFYGDGGTVASATIPVPADTISFSFTAFDPNNSPANPIISGPVTGTTGTSYDFTMTATDPDGDQIRYWVDWNMDGGGDEILPGTGHVASGTSQTASRSWLTAGAHTFQVIAQDSKGRYSGWVSHTITLTSVVNGACGAVDGMSFPTLTVASPGLCASGAVAGFAPNASGWGWTCNGSGGGTNSPLCSANITRYTLTVNKAGIGTVSWGTFTCGGTCSQTDIPHGTNMNLAAAPGGGSSFGAWAGCTSVAGVNCSVTMTSDRTVTASFIANPINGTCNPSVTGACQKSGYTGANACTSGVRNNFTSSGGGWIWDCNGLFGGTSQVDCSATVCRDFNLREQGQ